MSTENLDIDRGFEGMMSPESITTDILEACKSEIADEQLVAFIESSLADLDEATHEAVMNILAEKIYGERNGVDDGVQHRLSKALSQIIGGELESTPAKD